PAAQRLPRVDETFPDNEFGEKNQVSPTLWTIEVESGSNRARHWVLSKVVKRGSPMFVSALVLKEYRDLVHKLHLEHNLLLGGVIRASAALSDFMIYQFFRRPARDILQAMSTARGGNFASRARVRRPDELGEIAGRFNELMDDLSARDRERNAL